MIFASKSTLDSAYSKSFNFNLIKKTMRPCPVFERIFPRCDFLQKKINTWNIRTKIKRRTSFLDYIHLLTKYDTILQDKRQRNQQIKKETI